MSAKLIIYIPGKPLLHGYKRRRFDWSEAHKCYVYEGLEIEATDFNQKYEEAIKNCGVHIRPRVKVVACDAGHAARPASITPAPITPSARELTVEQAEEVMLRLAPDRLKKKTGPKPHSVLEVG